MTLDSGLLAAALIPIVAAIAVYARCVRLGLVWDDPLVLLQLQHMHGLRDVLVPPDIVPQFYYRPFTFLTFLADRGLAGESPWMLHATVVAWHVLVTLLVLLLARQLLGRGSIIEASMAALLFAVHPVHVESVAWIAGRSDVIATAFVVLAVLVAAEGRRAWTAWAAAAALLLACWSKEVGLAGFLLIPLRDALVERELRWRRYAPLLFAGAIYFVSRHAGLGAIATGLPADTSAGAVLRDLLAAVGWYTVMLFFPVSLNAYVPVVPAGAFYPLIGALTVAAFVFIGVWSWNARRGVPGFLILWWAVTLAPSLVVIVRRSASAVLAERYLYLPSVGAVILVAWLLTQLRPAAARWRVAMCVFFALALLGGVQSVLRTRVWADNLVFWGDVVAKVPDDALPHRELADAFMARDDLDQAEREYAAALRLPAGREARVMAFNNLGNLYVRRNQFDQAEATYREGLALHPHPHLYSGLGRVAMRRAEQAQARGDQQEVVRQVLAARDNLTRALTDDPDDFRSHALLGQVLISLGQRDAARQHLETALRLQPTGPIADVSRAFLRQLGS